MRLFHFTATEHLQAILAEGLAKGDVPISPTEGVNAVWLTTDDDPDGHGLSDGRLLTREERAACARVLGREPPENARFLNKRAVRIKVMIPSSDRRLVHWPKWARKRLDRDWYSTLDRTGGGKSASWYLFFGCITPGQFLAVDHLTD